MLEPGERDRVALVEIVEAADLIAQYVQGLDLEHFIADSRTCDAVAMRVYTITETSVHLSDAAREALGDLPWKQIRGLRNRIAHGYLTVNFERLWEIATTDVPSLAAAARQALGDDPDLPLPE